MAQRYPRDVYAIQHNITKRIYIGSSYDVRTRFLNHMALLRTNKHSSAEMQYDYDAYGDDFSLFILDKIDTYAENKKEFEWQQKYRTNDPVFGYNKKDPIKKTILHDVPLRDGLPEERGM